MRNLLHRLRGTPGDAAESSPVPAPASPPSTPPDGALVATYADFTSGGRLAVAFRDDRGRLALRVGQDGEVIPLPVTQRHEGHGLVSARVDLAKVAALPANEWWIYDVVLVDDRGVDHHLWIHHTERPMLPAPVGGRQFRARRGPAGFLKVEHRPVPPGVEVLAFAGDNHGIELVLPGDTPPGDLLLLEEGRVFASYPLLRKPDRCRATLTADPLPTGRYPTVTVAVGGQQEWVTVRRRSNGLVGPRHTVILPELFGEDPDHALLRLHFTRDAELTATLVEPDDASDGSGDTESAQTSPAAVQAEHDG